MEDWQKNLNEVLETVSEEVEKFFGDVTEAIDAIALLSEEVANQFLSNMTTEIDLFLHELVQPVLDIYTDIEQPATFESEWPLTDLIQPSVQQYPACIGCRHFHGQSYGGNLLVCGMHPYGWDGENCPDWEDFGMM
jgi:hypothetical protein